MSIKNSFLLFAFFLLPLATSGQDSTIALRRKPRAIIKFAPLSLLDEDATVQAGLEYRTGVRTSVQGEFGYGRKGLSLFGSDLDKFLNAEVWRGRAEVRFYNNRYRTNRRQNIAIRSDFPLGTYWAIEGLYKRINVLNQEDIYSATPPLTLLGSRQTPISRYVLGAHLKIGRQFSFYDPYKRLFSRTLIDMYIGAGVRWFTNDVPPRVGPKLFPTRGFGRSLYHSQSGVLPSITAGLKLGFAL